MPILSAFVCPTRRTSREWGPLPLRENNAVKKILHFP